MTAASLALLTSALLLASTPDFGDVERHIDQQLASRAERLEIVTSNGTFSHIEYKAGPDVAAPFAPPLSGQTVTAPRLTPFGSCYSNGFHLNRRDDRPCGFLVNIGLEKPDVNLLSFDRLELTASVTGSWQVALADAALAQKEDNVHVARLDAGASFSIPLQNLAGQLDLTRTRHLVFILESSRGTLDLQRISLRRDARNPTVSVRGIWLWDRRKIAGAESAIIRELASRGVNRVYLQIGDRPEELSSFLLTARRSGIAVYALDGSPDYVNAPDVLIKRLRNVLSYNHGHPEAPFAGFQIDVEPYLLKDFNLNRNAYAARFVALLRSLRTLAADTLPLSVVIPFWFDQVPAGNRSLAQSTVAEADEVVAMAYRTTTDAIVSCAATTLAWGERLNKPVMLGIELSRLPDEEHVVLGRASRSESGSYLLAGARWRERQRYRVSGGTLSFAGKQQELGALLDYLPPFSSFGGWVLHSYESLDR